MTRHVSIICGLLLTPLVTFSQAGLRGKVTDSEGKAVYGVKVHLEKTYLGTYTNEEGAYEIKKVPEGHYELTFEASGYEPLMREIDIVSTDLTVDISLERSVQMIEEMLVKVVTADEKTPTTYTNIETKEIEKNNFGQDLPFLLQNTTSAVVTSDAGAGVGYTGIRIRGVDPTRTNVTVNGIPLNDSESHGVYWVNMPDFASSVDDIQVQRGVGTSANGSAAFGASINVNTNRVNKEAYGTIDNTIGSFNTLRNSVSVGSGLINKKFTIDTRLSRITSDGYIDRASSNLKSFYLSGAWLGKKSQLKANIFSGKEITYQAWYGTPEAVIKGDENAIIEYADRNYIFGEDRENLLNSGRTYNYYTYDNEVDNYQQDHYQLHFSHRFSQKLKMNLAGHYTRGRGYYEQYRAGDDFATYGFDTLFLTADTITTTDLVRRRWLDNHFYGGIFSFIFQNKGINVTFGGGANQYLGTHFGEVIWAEYASNSSIRDRYYENDASKLEVQSYLKGTFRKKKVTYYGDIQLRHIEYNFEGMLDVNGEIIPQEQTATFDFINPKAGFMIDFDNRNNAYFSMAIANREPVREDFVSSTKNSRPKHEQLMDIETGYRFKGKKLYVNANLYYMNYQDQLILTGQINDVGAYTRTNVDDSYRAGVELEAGYMILKNLSISGNVAFSQNKILTFNEYIDNYDTYVQDSVVHSNTDLAFSPNVIAALGLLYEPITGLELGINSKYVGDQYLDNTSNDSRKLDAYFTTNVSISYTLKAKLFKELTIGLLVNNVFDELYENNGYTWGYIYGGERTVENFYYPQAGRNLLARLTIKL